MSGKRVLGILGMAVIAALGIGFVFAACAAIHYHEALRPAWERFAHYLSSIRAA